MIQIKVELVHRFSKKEHKNAYEALPQIAGDFVSINTNHVYVYGP
ncbi:hypothetical protein JCM10914A_52010 [Paenibacillus sp. JCM 10914]